MAPHSPLSLLFVEQTFWTGLKHCDVIRERTFLNSLKNQNENALKAFKISNILMHNNNNSKISEFKKKLFKIFL